MRVPCWFLRRGRTANRVMGHCRSLLGGTSISEYYVWWSRGCFDAPSSVLMVCPKQSSTPCNPTILRAVDRIRRIPQICKGCFFLIELDMFLANSVGFLSTIWKTAARHSPCVGSRFGRTNSTGKSPYWWRVRHSDADGLMVETWESGTGIQISQHP